MVASIYDVLIIVCILNMCPDKIAVLDVHIIDIFIIYIFSHFIIEIYRHFCFFCNTFCIRGCPGGRLSSYSSLA